MRVPVQQALFSDIARGIRDIRGQHAAIYVLNGLHDATYGRPDLKGLVFTSGYRSYAHQMQLYVAYRAGRGPVAAKPGSSWHHFLPDPQKGRRWAVDLKLEGNDDPRSWVNALVEAMKDEKMKFHTAATERTWVHLQGVYGGGIELNPGIIAHW